MTKFLEITSKRKGGHWRAGTRHADTSTLHPLDRFDAGQLAALKADPHLVVREVEVPAPKSDPAGAGTSAPQTTGGSTDPFAGMNWSEVQATVEAATGVKPRSKADAYEMWAENEAKSKGDGDNAPPANE